MKKVFSDIIGKGSMKPVESNLACNNFSVLPREIKCDNSHAKPKKTKCAEEEKNGLAIKQMQLKPQSKLKFGQQRNNTSRIKEGTVGTTLLEESRHQRNQLRILTDKRKVESTLCSSNKSDKNRKNKCGLPEGESRPLISQSQLLKHKAVKRDAKRVVPFDFFFTSKQPLNFANDQSKHMKRAWNDHSVRNAFNVAGNHGRHTCTQLELGKASKNSAVDVQTDNRKQASQEIGNSKLPSRLINDQLPATSKRAKLKVCVGANSSVERLRNEMKMLKAKKNRTRDADSGNTAKSRNAISTSCANLPALVKQQFAGRKSVKHIGLQMGQVRRVLSRKIKTDSSRSRSKHLFPKIEAVCSKLATRQTKNIHALIQLNKANVLSQDSFLVENCSDALHRRRFSPNRSCDEPQSESIIRFNGIEDFFRQ